MSGVGTESPVTWLRTVQVRQVSGYLGVRNVRKLRVEKGGEGTYACIMLGLVKHIDMDCPPRNNGPRTWIKPDRKPESSFCVKHHLRTHIPLLLSTP